MLSLHYYGSSTHEVIRNLITELQAIAEEMQWKYTIIDDERFVGIILNTHEKCEPFYFMLNKDGKLINLVWLNDENPPEEAFYIAVKTNFAPVDNHITIIKLLKYIKKKYIPDLTVIDEGDYWETEDKEILQFKFDFLLKKFDQISSLLENNLSADDKLLSAENLADKIENILKKGLNKPED